MAGEPRLVRGIGHRRLPQASPGADRRSRNGPAPPDRAREVTADFPRNPEPAPWIADAPAATHPEIQEVADRDGPQNPWERIVVQSVQAVVAHDEPEIPRPA